MQRVRPAIERLDAELAGPCPGSRRLYPDGAVLYDYATSSKDEGTAEAARELSPCVTTSTCSTRW